MDAFVYAWARAERRVFRHADLPSPSGRRVTCSVLVRARVRALLRVYLSIVHSLVFFFRWVRGGASGCFGMFSCYGQVVECKAAPQTQQTCACDQPSKPAQTLSSLAVRLDVRTPAPPVATIKPLITQPAVRIAAV
jgi:hypothetical protein